MSESSDFAPEHYFCALTGELMEHPYQHTSTGISYERKAMLEFIYFGNGSVLNLHPSQFVDNPELEEEIKKWKECNQIEASETADDEDDDDDDVDNKKVVKNALKFNEKLTKQMSAISQKVLKAQKDRVRAYTDAQKVKAGKLAPMGPEESGSRLDCCK